MLLIILTAVSSQTSVHASTSPPAIEWQEYYGGTIQYASNLIQTSDGGYVFMDLGWSYSMWFKTSTVFKVDSSGDMQWNKTIDFFRGSTIIQTNDEGYEIAGKWATPYGTTHIFTPTVIKTNSEVNIQWVQNYTTVPDLGIDSSEFQSDGSGFRKDGNIQTSDGGFVYWQGGTITKTDSNNETQWMKTLTYPTLDAYPTYTRPLSLFSVIETSDGALAALGVGYSTLGNPRTGKIYLIKTESFLPLPSQAPLPTPLPTPSATSTATPYQTPIIGAAFVALVFAVAIALLLYLKKRKC